MNSLIAQARELYHNQLLDEGVLTIDNRGVPSNADKASALSIRIAKGVADLLMTRKTQGKAVGQTSGAKLEQINMQSLQATFPRLQSLRPGKWHIVRLGNRSPIKTSSFAQYAHLDYLTHLIKEDAILASSLGNDYMVAPDVVIYRETEPDEAINRDEPILDETVCKLCNLRKSNGSLPILHASISAKWTMRSDRAQNSRTEALGLIRNRKGHLPHIVVVTGEPLPSRIASLAMGTGDIDCVYHFVLYELVKAVEQTEAEDSIELLRMLVKGNRLKDISDLPIDLAV